MDLKAMGAGWMVFIVATVPPVLESADTWTDLTTVQAPTPRGQHSAVWTGSEMIIWGGTGDAGLENSGARYNPADGEWTPLSTIGAPPARNNHAGVWTGSEMLVWGGGPSLQGTGGRYDPSGDSWVAMATSGAPSPRYYHTAIWTGSVMIVWGGWDGGGYVADGAMYDPDTDTWTAMNLQDAPSARGRHSAVWTGTQMIIWGGYSTDGVGGETYHSGGGRFDPATNSWSALETSGAPAARRNHSAVWTGDEMIVWGGEALSSELRTGGRFSPATGAWVSMTTTGAPSARIDHIAVWTGLDMVVWGGFQGPNTHMSSGARYRPSVNRWLDVDAPGTPTGRRWHRAIWTGNDVLIWGGRHQDFSSGTWLDSGARLTLDPWMPVAPFPFRDSFEVEGPGGGGFGAFWDVSTVGGGRITRENALPVDGLVNVRLDEASGYASSTAGLILHVDLAGRDDVVLDFWWHEIGDAMYVNDGVSMSVDAGATWLDVLPFSGSVSSYQNSVVDLDQIATSAGVSLVADTLLRFQFHDFVYSTVNDGYRIDDIVLRSSALPVLTASLGGVGSGVVTSNPVGIDCPDDCTETYAHSMEVILTATPDVASSFAGWAGDPDCLDGDLNLIAETHCTALFEVVVPLIFSDGFESGTTDSW